MGSPASNHNNLSEKRTSAFSMLGRGLGAARTPVEVAKTIVGAADLLFPWDACVFDLVADDPGKISTVLCIDTVNGKRQEFSPEAHCTELSELARKVLTDGPQLIVGKGAETAKGKTVPFGDKKARSASLMFVPIRKEGGVAGLLSLQSYAANAYTAQDLAMLEALADHCAGALERIRAETELERVNLESREELERRVQDRTAQLEAINKELEAFCYSVSHDLRAPLRSVRGFSEVLLERYAEKLDAQGQEFLRRAVKSCHHMDSLIDDLLKLSRVTRAELQVQNIDLSNMAQTIVEDLRKTQPSRKTEVLIQPGLRTEGDERLLRVALDNLMGNAWKFTGKRSEARIEFGKTQSPQKAFYIKDNGAGFDMRYQERLFGVFQRLHSLTEFPGTGVGLATVQRIINRHGGKAWAEGKVDEGATFYFTLPRETQPPEDTAQTIPRAAEKVAAGNGEGK
jgi:signal transduction histidine kinase